MRRPPPWTPCWGEEQNHPKSHPRWLGTPKRSANGARGLSGMLPASASCGWARPSLVRPPRFCPDSEQACSSNQPEANKSQPFPKLFASEPREAIDLLRFLKQNTPWANICWKAGMDPAQSKLLSPLQSPNPKPESLGSYPTHVSVFGSPMKPAEMAAPWGINGSFTPLLHPDGAQDGSPSSPVHAAAPTACLSLQTLREQPLLS